MKPLARLQRTAAEDGGQIIPLHAFMMVLIMGMAGLSLDFGRAYVCQRELQGSTDAAALAGAYAMAQPGASATTVQAKVNAYSSYNAGLNGGAMQPGVSSQPTVTMHCDTTNSYIVVGCNGSATGDNVIQVTQTAQVPTTFIQALSVFWRLKPLKTMTVSATSTASLVGSNPQLNVAIVLDTTASMGGGDSDPSCNSTRIACALNGVQSLLKGLQPCAPGTTVNNSSCKSWDNVSLFTFPNVTAQTAANDFTCPTSNPSIVPYTTPAAPTSTTTTWNPPTGGAGTYQITSYLNNYSSNYTQNGTLNASSYLAIATGASGVKGCSGMQTPGGDETYYAGAINQAETSLLAQQYANAGSQNVMIILSDGDANSTKIANAKHSGNVYGSADDECQQGVAAAQNATALGTTVYTVAYGASSSGCSTDKSGPNSGLSPCTAMEMMSSGWASGNTSHFFSDSTSSQSTGQCKSPNGATSGGLTGIFNAINVQIGKSRLIPNSQF